MIDLINVRKAYPNGTIALDGVNLHIDDGEFVFVVGHSGAGKSTLVKLLLREEKPSSGKILVSRPQPKGKENAKKQYYNLGRLPYYSVPYYRRTLGVVFQDFRLFPDQTVYENVAFAMRVVGTSPANIRRRVPAILNTVNLSEKAKCFPRELSGGEQQRVALARALMCRPKLILADEPTGNLDRLTGAEIMRLLFEANDEPLAVAMVTHSAEAAAMCDRTLTLEKGKLQVLAGVQGKTPPV